MKKQSKRVLAIGTAAIAVALGVGVISAELRGNMFLKSDADESYSLTFSKPGSTLQTISAGGKQYEYAYANSTGGSKYGGIVANSEEHDSEDLFAMKGTSNFLYFSYGDISSDASYSEARFNKKIKSVSLEAKYISTNDYKLYTRVYFSEDGTWSDSNRLGYTTTKEYTTISFDLSSKEAYYIKIGLSNAYSTYHFKSITIVFDC